MESGPLCARITTLGAGSRYFDAFLSEFRQRYKRGRPTHLEFPHQFLLQISKLTHIAYHKLEKQKNMPAIAPGSKVLVTGANGFAAIHIVDVLLKRGYSVRATIRSSSKGTHLQKVFGKYGDKLELVVVPDITKVRCILTSLQ